MGGRATLEGSLGSMHSGNAGIEGVVAVNFPRSSLAGQLSSCGSAVRQQPCRARPGPSRFPSSPEHSTPSSLVASDRVALFFDGDPPFDAFELQLDKDDVVERSQVFNSELDGGWKVKVSGDGDACLLGEHWQSRRKPTVPRYTNADDDKRMPGELSDCMLIRLRYASLLAPDVTSSDIDVIVDRAAAWNREHGITGVLAIEGESVLQVLEGPGKGQRTILEDIRRPTTPGSCGTRLRKHRGLPF